MAYKDEKAEQEQKKRDRRKRIDQAIAKVNKTPSRVTVSDSTEMCEAVIHRIPLKLFTMDRLWDFSFWIIAIPLGIPLGIPFFAVGSELAFAPRHWWIGIPMGAFLWYGILLLRFLHRYRPIRIRIQGDTFYLDSTHGSQWTGKLTKEYESDEPLKLFVDGTLFQSSLVYGWVTLNIAHRRSRQIDALAGKAYRLKLDDARKLIAFARANKLDLSIDTEVSRVLRKHGSSPGSDSD